MNEYTLFFYSEEFKKSFWQTYNFDGMRELNSTPAASFVETKTTAERILEIAPECVYKVETGNKLFVQVNLI